MSYTADMRSNITHLASRRCWRIAALAAFLLSAHASLARAEGICVEVDPRRDSLQTSQREAVRLAVLGLFENEGLAIDIENTACTETYVIYNLQLGATFTIAIKGPRGTRTGTANSVDDMAYAYRQLVQSLIHGEDDGAGGKKRLASDPVVAESLKYVRLGYGFIRGDDNPNGVAFGLGYRRELSFMAFDLSLFNFMLTNGEKLSDRLNGSWARLMLLRYSKKVASSSSYVGVGLSFGRSRSVLDEALHKGDGAQGEVTIGYEMRRTASFRFYLQVDVTMPFYMSTTDNTGSEKWTPSGIVSLGFGSGKIKPYNPGK